MPINPSWSRCALHPPIRRRSRPSSPKFSRTRARRRAAAPPETLPARATAATSCCCKMDSIADQQAYMAWRDSTGVLQKFLGHSPSPADVAIWERNAA